MEPNSFGRWPDQPAYADPPQGIGNTADHFDFRADDDNYFEQPGNLFRLMDADAQQRLFDNTARAIKGARSVTVTTHIENFTRPTPPTATASAKPAKPTAHSDLHQPRILHGAKEKNAI